MKLIRMQLSSVGCKVTQRVQRSSQGCSTAHKGAAQLTRVQHSSQRCHAAHKDVEKLDASLLSRCSVDQTVQSSSDGCSIAQKGAA